MQTPGTNAQICNLQLWAIVPGFPQKRLTDLTVMIGSRFFERHQYFDTDSTLRQAGRILLYDGPFITGEYPFSVHTSIETTGKEGGRDPFLQDAKILIKPGNATILIHCDEAGISTTEQSDVRQSQLTVRFQAKKFPQIRIRSVALFAGDALLCDYRHKSQTIHADMMVAPDNISDTAEFTFATGALDFGNQQLLLFAKYLLEGEADERIFKKTRIINLSPGESTLDFSIPEKILQSSAAQRKKINDLARLRHAILKTIKSGKQYRTADKEGGWLQIIFRDGKFRQTSGNYAEAIVHAEKQLGPEEALDSMLESTRMSSPHAGESELLQILHGSLREP